MDVQKIRTFLKDQLYPDLEHTVQQRNSTLEKLSH